MVSPKRADAASTTGNRRQYGAWIRFTKDCRGPESDRQSTAMDDRCLFAGIGGFAGVDG
ncbi:hypothetical protein D3C84_1079130 [compost metagenome]